MVLKGRASTQELTVIASGTLGRQEPPGSISDYSEVARQGDYATNEILLDTSEAEPLTTAAIDSTSRS